MAEAFFFSFFIITVNQLAGVWLTWFTCTAVVLLWYVVGAVHAFLPEATLQQAGSLSFADLVVADIRYHFQLFYNWLTEPFERCIDSSIWHHFHPHFFAVDMAIKNRHLQRSKLSSKPPSSPYILHLYPCFYEFPGCLYLCVSLTAPTSWRQAPGSLMEASEVLLFPRRLCFIRKKTHQPVSATSSSPWPGLIDPRSIQQQNDKCTY